VQHQRSSAQAQAQAQQAEQAEQAKAAKEAMALAERLAAEKAESKSRKVRPEDLFGGEQAVQQKADIKLTDDKVKNHKMQGEFGAKKFIKP